MTWAASNQEFLGFDIIGDIHGCDESLVNLLEQMDYTVADGCYRHPYRQAIFVGDILDRGPGILNCLQIIKPMVDAGAAQMVLGNHEYNALRSRDILTQVLFQGEVTPEAKPHKRLLKLMQATLEQFKGRLEEWELYLNWFTQLPLFIDTGSFRVVHACWDDLLIQEYWDRYKTNVMPRDFLQASMTWDSWESRVVDRLTRGTTLPLPDGVKLKSEDGFVRRFFRAKFWSESPQTYADVVFQPDPLPYDVQQLLLRRQDKNSLVHYPLDASPVFFGHYWLKGRPKPLRDNIACLDYSAVNYGRLVAYRYSGEKTLTPDNFTWVYVDP